MTLLFYELAGAEENRRFSPYCWRRHCQANQKLVRLGHNEGRR